VWDEEDLHPVQQVCAGLPHAAIQSQGLSLDHLGSAPPTFSRSTTRARNTNAGSTRSRSPPEDCTGCTLCVQCAGQGQGEPRHKVAGHVPQSPLRGPERINYQFFLDLPEVDRSTVKLDVKGTQFCSPCSSTGCCAGCGETPYIKLMTQFVRRPGAHRQRQPAARQSTAEPATTPYASGRRAAAAPGLPFAVRGPTRSSASGSAWPDRPARRHSPRTC